MKKLNWKYCECGCKNSTLDLLGIHFSLFNSLKGPYWLAVGQHHAQVYGIKYDDYDAAMKKVRDVLIERQTRNEKDLKQIGKL